MTGKAFMNASDASRIQSSQAKADGDMSSKGFAARAQSAAQTNTNSGLTGSASAGNRGTNSGGSAGSTGTSQQK